MARIEQVGPVAETLAATIKAAREELGWSMAALERETARRGGRVDARYIALIEQQKRAVGIEELLSISAATGRPLPWFLLPLDADADTRVGITVDDYATQYTAQDVWRWLTAQAPLPDADDPSDLAALAGLTDDEIVRRVRAAAASQTVARPVWAEGDDER